MKPESRAIKRVRDEIRRQQLPIHLDKTNNPYAAGWLDLYVEAPSFVGWIEAKYQSYKYRPGEVIPTMSDTKARSIIGQFSAQQLERAQRHVNNNIPTACLCGFDGPNQQLRTYALFEFSGRKGELIWPRETAVFDIHQAMAWLYKWTISHD